MLQQLITLYYFAHCEYQSLVLELSHDKTANWTLMIMHRASNTTIFYMNSYYLGDLAIQGYNALKTWLDKTDEEGADKFLQYGSPFQFI